MSFKNSPNSTFGEANAVYSYSFSSSANPQKAKVTGLVRFVAVAGRYAARYAAAAARNLSRYMDEMAINTACFAMKDSDSKKLDSAMLDELKKIQMASLN